jgi:hypothetical protein
MRGSTIRWSGPETPWPRTRRGGSRLAQSSRRRSALRARRASAVHHRSLGTNVTPRISLFASDSAVTFPPRRARTTAVARCFRRTPAYRRAEAGAADRACPTGGAGASLPLPSPEGTPILDPAPAPPELLHPRRPVGPVAARSPTWSTSALHRAK